MKRLKLLLLTLLVCPSLMAVNIIPYPAKLEIKEGIFNFGDKIQIQNNKHCEKSANLLMEQLRDDYGIGSELTSQRASEVKFLRDKSLEEEAYHLTINSDGVEITAAGDTGWFYGTQSLLQILDMTNLENITASHLIIEDKPRFEWRAYMLDESRHFKGMEHVKKLLNEMALLKMNVFHWHLTDDQGWRIEIKQYPLLTQVGSKRKSTQVGPLKWKSTMQSGIAHEGFYTQEQIREIIDYAQQRNITIVPEIEMPGHSCAAVAAYPWVGTAKKPMDVMINFGKSLDIYDVTSPQTIEFLQNVLDEVIELFPSEVIHIGGDEVRYDHWENSPTVRAYMQEHGIESYAELQLEFTNKISQYIQSKGRRMMGWNEILGHNVHHFQTNDKSLNEETSLAKNSLVHYWVGSPNIAIKAAQDGFQIVNSNNWETYLDYDYDRIPLSRAYAFDPIPAGLPQEYHDNVVGTGCQMWSEWIPTPGELHFMTFPRIAAYAEVGWSEPSQKNYERFREALPALQERWTRKEIYYAPDSVVEGTKTE